MSNSRRNFLSEETRKELNKRIAEVANPGDLKAASPIQQKYFLLMRYESDPKKRIELAKKMQREMAAQSSRNVNSKL